MGLKGAVRTVSEYLDSNRATWLILGLGLLLRIITLAVLSPHPLQSDALSYHRSSLEIASGGLPTDWPPGLPGYLALNHFLFGASMPVSRASMLLIYAAFCFALYKLAAFCLNRRAANLALLFFALYPAFVYQSAEPLTQLPAAACLLATIYLLISARPERTARAAASLGLLGFLLGCGTLIRPSSALLIPFAVGVIFVKVRRIWPPATVLATSLLVIGLWIGNAYRITGHFVPINHYNSMNLFIGNNQHTPLYKTWWLGSHSTEQVPEPYQRLVKSIRDLPPGASDRAFTTLAIKHILSRPDLFVLRTFNRICCFFAFDTHTASSLRELYSMSTWGVLPVLGLDALFYFVAVAGAVMFLLTCSRQLGTQAQWVIVAGTAMIYAVPYWFSFAHPTYHLPVVAVLGVLASGYVERQLVATESVQSEGSKRMPRVNQRAAALLAVLVVIQVEWVVMMAVRL